MNRQPQRWTTIRFATLPAASAFLPMAKAVADAALRASVDALQ
jgi:hypothetical protein